MELRNRGICAGQCPPQRLGTNGRILRRDYWAGFTQLRSNGIGKDNLMLSHILNSLLCPICGADLTLTLDGQTVRCSNGHDFDVSRYGYVNLLSGKQVSKTDTGPMVEAREAFFRSGHYRSLSDLLAGYGDQLLTDVDGGCIVDIGGGTGHYLAAMLERQPERLGVVLDASKYAARRAARAHPRIGAVVADAWQRLPIRDSSAALVLNVFAPRNGPEFQRILRRDGALVVVTPNPRHLQELVAELGMLSVDDRKEARLSEQLGPYFELIDTQVHDRAMHLSHDEIAALIGMGPSAWHSDVNELRQKIDSLSEPSTATLSVTVSAYRPV
ncbi:MAG TPA: 23S rRNA methyltransferase [Chloroflexota bacterium]|nr:23S rRNA methyltransferase [Chloroflexota bacterium]